MAKAADSASASQKEPVQVAFVFPDFDMIARALGIARASLDAAIAANDAAMEMMKRGLPLDELGQPFSPPRPAPDRPAPEQKRTGADLARPAAEAKAAPATMNSADEQTFGLPAEPAASTVAVVPDATKPAPEPVERAVPRR